MGGGLRDENIVGRKKWGSSSLTQFTQKGKHMMRKRGLALLTMAVVLTVGMSGAAFADEAEKPYEGTTLYMLRHAEDEVSVFEEVLEDFTAETGIEVIIDAVPYSDLQDKQTIELSAGVSSYDLMVAPGQWLTDYASAGWISDLDTFLNSDLYDDAFQFGDISED